MQDNRQVYEESIYSPAMRSALHSLRDLISKGWEFPDACWKVARQSGLTVDEIRDAYDDVDAH